MAEIPLDPSVAAVSPNFYSAIIKGNYSAGELAMINEYSRSWNTGKKLLKLSEKQARQQFLKLDPDVQNNIRFTWPNKEIFQPEQNIVGKITKNIGSAATKALGLALSPAIGAFKAAGEYGKTLNTPYKAYKQTQQGIPFSKKLLTESYNGQNSWHWKKVAEYEKQYGKALTTLLRGNAEGKNIGESIDMYGTADADMYQAIRFMGDEPVKFQNLLEKIKLDAQVSPGRDFMNYVVKNPSKPVDKNHWAVKFSAWLGMDVTTKEGTEKARKIASGPIDAIYQLAIDPLSYVGIGPGVKAATKGVEGIKATPTEALKFVGLKSRGERMADSYQLISQRAGTASVGLDWAFKQPDVIAHWDELGLVIKDYIEPVSPTARSLAWNRIKQKYPQWAKKELIRAIGSTMKKTNDYNVKGAKEFFTHIDDFNTFLSGPVEGISSRRNGIITARFGRNMKSAAQRSVYETFNPALSSKSTADAIAKNDAGLMDIMDTLKKVSDDNEKLLNPDIEDLFKLQKDFKKTRKIAYAIGTGLSRSPGRILWGDDAIKTIENVRNLANQVMDTNYADAFAEAFLDEPADIQLTMIRNLYHGFMIKAGMGGDANGIAMMEEILAKTFNEKAGMLSTTRSEIPLDWVNEISPNVIRYENDLPFQATKGIVQPSQITEGIAPLPYDLIYQYGAMSKFSQKFTFFNLTNRIVKSKSVSVYQNEWSRFTLFPRLGIRSSIDEAFFHIITAPFYNVRQYLMGSAIFPTRALTTASGSKSAQGMYSRGIYKLIPKLDPTLKISKAERVKAVQELAAKESEKLGYTVPQSEIAMSIIREDLVGRVKEIYKNTVPENAWQDIVKLMKHNPNAFDAMIQSLGAKSSISGKIDVEYIDSLFTPSNLSRMYNDKGLIGGKKYTAKQISQMSEEQVAVAHFDNWSIRFSYNKTKIAEYLYIDPVPVFFENNALKTKVDFTTARDDLMEKMGAIKSADGYVISNPQMNERFLSKFSSTVYYRQQGIPEAEITRIHIENMLLDMRNTFHGGPTSYNNELFNLIKTKHDEVVAYRIKAKKDLENSWSDAASNLEFDEFQKATVGRHGQGEINTRLISNGQVKDMGIFEEPGGFGNLYSKIGDLTMDVMDATVTGMYRQKALWIYYHKNLQELKPYEVMLARRHEKMLIEQGMPAKLAKERATNYAEKKTVEIAWKDASEKLIEYVDNPEIRTNLAIAVRSVGRYYRATEDFQRRMWRVFTKTPLRTMYRLRLLHTGIEASGDIYEDEQGEKYVVFPTDIVINGAIEPVIRALTGNKTFSLPTYNEFTMKLRLINPSFAPDAGQPALAGPIGAVSTLSMSALVRYALPTLESLGLVSGDTVDKFTPKAEKLSGVVKNIGLGNFADSMTFTKAIIPMLGQTLGGAATAKIASTTDAEWDRQLTTATIQAIQYFQANGYGIDESASEKEKYEYIKNLKIGTANVMVARTLLGYISPGMPSIKNTKDLPNYMKKVGITSFKSEFWDVYNGLLRNAGDDVTNIYDLAVATFIGKNPGKLLFTVPTNEKEFKVFINQTNEVKDWAINNGKFIDIYDEVAWMFAPKVGEYNSDVYNFMDSAGLIKNPKLADYLNTLQIADDKELYFEIGKSLDEKLSKVGYSENRRSLIAQAERDKKRLITSNPYLEKEINGSIDDRGNLKVKFKLLTNAVDDKSAPIDNKTRKAMKLIIREVSSFMAIGDDPELSQRYDYTELKAQKKQEVVNLISTFAKSNSAVNEANRLIFRGILNAYSRDTVISGPREVNR